MYDNQARQFSKGMQRHSKFESADVVLERRLVYINSLFYEIKNKS